MARRLVASGVLSLLLLVAVSVHAEQESDQYYGQVVSEVRFEVDGRPLTGPTLTNLLDLADVKAGQPLTRENVRESMDHLFRLQRYEDIVPVVLPSATGPVVVFRLTPRYPIGRIEITGETGVSTSSLRDEIRQRFGGASTAIRTDAVKEAVTEFLNDAGYLNPVVTATTAVEADADTATLVIDVNAGRPAPIRRSEVKGSSPVPAAEVVEGAHASTGQAFRCGEMEEGSRVIEGDVRVRSDE